MNDALILIVLAVLVPTTALNLFLALRLAARLREGSEPVAMAALPVGETLPVFKAHRQADGRPVTTAALAGQPAVLAFLSPGCPACRQKAAELLDILPAMRSAQVALWIMCTDPVHDISDLVGETPLREHVLVHDEATRRSLNPWNAAPFYIFVDDRTLVQANNYMGDEDWRTFVAQMQDLGAAGATAH